MSQYPYSPYQQPSPAYYDPNVQRLYAPARRSAVLMFVVAGFMVMCGMCVGTLAKIGPLAEMAASSGVRAEDIATLGVSPSEFIRIAYFIMCGVAILMAIVFGVLGAFVRKGGMAPAVTSLVLVILLGMFTLLQLIAAVVQTLAKRDPLMGIAIVLIGAFFLLLVWLLVSLIGAIRSASTLRQANAQYAQYYWQMQQQAYQQGAYAGYGYGAAPPTITLPVPPPPPPDASTRGPDESELRP